MTDNVVLGREQFSQLSDLPIQCKEFHGEDSLSLLVRFMYFRSSESRSSVDPKMAIGQDYLEWNYFTTEDMFNFVVCDGVGQSFLGYIASRFLGQRFMDWLEKKGRDLVRAYLKRGENSIKEIIVAEINNWKEDGFKEVQQAELPDSLPAIVKEALDDSRISHGSETVFVSGHISLYEKKTYLVLLWLGDVRFRLFQTNGTELNTGAVWTNTERWSTKVGLAKSAYRMPNIRVYDLSENQVDRIMVYSDGLSTIENSLQGLSSAELQDKANDLLLTPSSDDIAFIEILLQPYSPKMVEQFRKMPQKRRNDDQLSLTPNKRGNTEYELSWQQLNDVKQFYLLEYSKSSPIWREIFRSTQRETRYMVKDRLPDNYQFKLVAIYPGADEAEGPAVSLSIDAGHDSKLESENQELFQRQFPVQLSSSPAKNIPVQPQTILSNPPQLTLGKPEWNVDPTLDLINKTVTLNWKSDKNAADYSIAIRDDQNQTLTIPGIRETSYTWVPNDWKGEYQISIRSHRGPAMPVASDPKMVNLSPKILPSPRIMGMETSPARVGEKFILTCESSMQPYTGTCKYIWMRGDTPEMAVGILSEMPKPILELFNDRPGTYYFKVKVEQNGVSSIWSNAVGVQVTDTLDVPKITYPLDGATFSGDFTLNWTDVPGAKEYIIEYKDIFSWKSIDKSNLRKNGTNWECILKDNIPGKAMRLRVKVRDQRGREKTSPEIKVTVSNKIIRNVVPSLTPIKITSVKPNPDYESCTVSWENTGPTKKYKVILFGAEPTKSFIGHYDANFKTCLSVNLSSPGNYFFCVVEADINNGTYQLPVSNEGYFGFSLPLGKPVYIGHKQKSPGKLPNTWSNELEFRNVKHATSYQFLLDNYPVIKLEIRNNNDSIMVQIDLQVGKYSGKFQALNKNLGVESQFVSVNFDVVVKSSGPINKLI